MDYAAVPDDIAIKREAQRNNVPVFQFSRSIDVDDLVWSDSCHSSANHYPLVGVRSAKTKAERAVHFDTGSQLTFMDIGVLEQDFGETFGEDALLFNQPVNGSEVAMYRRPISFHLVDHREMSPRVRITVHVPKAWVDLPVHRRVCAVTCMETRGDSVAERYGIGLTDHGARSICKFRWGLLGRNVLLETKLSFKLDGSSRLVSIDSANAEDLDG